MVSKEIREGAFHYSMTHIKPFLPESLITFTGRSAIDGLSPYRPFTFAAAPLDAPIQECRTVFYTPPVSASVARLEKEVLVGAVELSWPMERRCLRQEGSSCAPLKREEQKTQKAKSHQNKCTPPPVSFGDLQKRYHRKSRCWSSAFSLGERDHRKLAGCLRLGLGEKGIPFHCLGPQPIPL
jgi:hypothetical protein